MATNETIRVVNKHGAEIWGPALPSKVARKFDVGVNVVPLAYFYALDEHGLGKGLEILIRAGMLQLGEDPPAPAAAPDVLPELASVSEQLAWISHETNHELLAKLARDPNSLIATAADDRINQLEK